MSRICGRSLGSGAWWIYRGQWSSRSSGPRRLKWEKSCITVNGRAEGPHWQWNWRGLYKLAVSKRRTLIIPRSGRLVCIEWNGSVVCGDIMIPSVCSAWPPSSFVTNLIVIECVGLKPRGHGVQASQFIQIHREDALSVYFFYLSTMRSLRAPGDTHFVECTLLWFLPDHMISSLAQITLWLNPGLNPGPCSCQSSCLRSLFAVMGQARIIGSIFKILYL